MAKGLKIDFECFICCVRRKRTVKFDKRGLENPLEGLKRNEKGKPFVERILKENRKRKVIFATLVGKSFFEKISALFLNE